MVSPSFYTFLWVLAAAFVLAAIYGLRAYLGYKSVKEDAVEDYDYKLSEGMTPKHINHEVYIQAYVRAHAPRHLVYMTSAMSAVILLTWPTLVIIQFVLDKIWILSGRSEVIEPGYLVWKFIIFFSLIATWATIVFITARSYHSKAPGSFQTELSKAAHT